MIRQFVLGTASSIVGGALLTQRILAAGSPVLATGKLVLTVSDFPALAEELGSVRLDVGLDKPIIINRSDGFHVLSAFCQHNGCTVERYDPLLGAMRCPCHGSRYNIDGTLNQGPAARGLNRFEAVFDGNDTLSVVLPGVGHAVKTVTSVTTVVGRRLRLTFHARIFTGYQVLRQTTLPGPAQPVAFAMTADAPATQTVYVNSVFNAADPLPEVAVYVDAPQQRGFFAIALLPSET